jgi:DNA invertase Pin-like site-specific DNA recombinase
MPQERRAAIYLRVSSEEQTYENQRPDVKRLARARGYKIVATYEEQASAVKTRPEYTRMMSDAHRGMFNVLVVWALDRFGRSMVGNMQAVLELDHRGVEVVSVREPWLDTSGAVRPLLIAIFSWIAEQERSRLSERTRAGMERARRDGVHIGRPAVRIDVRRARALRAEGLSLREVASRLRATSCSIVLPRARRLTGSRRP